MKFLFLPLLAAFFCTSCRTVTPLDPMTMKPCSKCLPENYQQKTEDCYGCSHQVESGK